MVLICPACRKANETEAASSCARCGCDLSALASLMLAAASRLADAGECLRNRQWQQALEGAEESWTWRHTPSAARVAFLAAAALGDTRRAFHWRNRVD